MPKYLEIKKGLVVRLDNEDFYAKIEEIHHKGNYGKMLISGCSINRNGIASEFGWTMIKDMADIIEICVFANTLTDK